MRPSTLLAATLLLAACRSLPDPSALALLLDRDRLFVGEYTELRVGLAPGWTFDQLELVVPAGPAGGHFSFAREDDFDPRRPEVLLLAGYEPGVYEVHARSRATGAVLTTTRFEVLGRRADPDEGPSFWLGSETQHLAGSIGAAWGGGPLALQNFDVSPPCGGDTPCPFRVALVFLDTKSSRYDPADLGDLEDEWMEALVDGTPAGGQLVSAAHWFREVSGDRLIVSGAAAGPVSLDGEFEDYFEFDEEREIWLTTDDGKQAFATAADGVLDFRNFQPGSGNEIDAVVYIVKSVPGTDPAQYSWAHASLFGHTVKVDDCLDGTQCDVAPGFIALPDDWEARQSGRPNAAILAHELGHNLGLMDIYTIGDPGPAIADRSLDDWDLMANEWELPHLSLPHRMRLGWLLDESWVKRFNFAEMPAPVQETVLLHPAERTFLPAGHHVGVEVRIADGWNYYFEYRSEQPGQIGDQSLPKDRRVLGTELVSDAYYNPANALLLLKEDLDGDGPVLDTGDDYDETDIEALETFSLSVVDKDADHAEVLVEYGVGQRPELWIRPWDGTYQSPDIEVVNARSLADPAWENVPWAGHPNLIFAQVSNGGGLLAESVEVEFVEKRYSVNGTPTSSLGVDVQDVEKGQTVTFSAVWVPKDEGHTCIEVRIEPYSKTVGDPPALVEETSTWNNVAQSNYDRFLSVSASPYSRAVSSLEIVNPLDRETTMWIEAEQSNPLYRTYLAHRWLRLAPGEARTVEVMFEYAGVPLIERNPDLQAREDEPNDVRFTGLLENPGATRPHTRTPVGGARAVVSRGRAARVSDLRRRGDDLLGRVTSTDGDVPAPGGKVLLVHAADAQDPLSHEYSEAEVGADGRFRAPIEPGQWEWVEAYYVPAPGWGDATSARLTGVVR